MPAKLTRERMNANGSPIGERQCPVALARASDRDRAGNRSVIDGASTITFQGVNIAALSDAQVGQDFLF